MTTIAIEINDVGISAATQAGPLGEPSPGYALLDRGAIQVGREARAAARLKPRFVHNRFWQQLDSRSLHRPFPRGLSHADLVHAHLSGFWDELLLAADTTSTEVSAILVLPGSYDTEQVSLLLGIARAADIPVTGLVDTAIAATRRDSNAPLLYLDIHLHQAVWTEIEGGARCRTEVVPDSGVLQFQDIWARLISERFVRETRFDPLHQGSSEQALFEQLPNWAADLPNSGRSVFSLDANGATQSIEISSDRLVGASEDLLTRIAAFAAGYDTQNSRPSVALSHRAAGIPGIAEMLTESTGNEPLRLDARNAAFGAVRARQAIETPGTNLPLVLSLPPTDG